MLSFPTRIPNCPSTTYWMVHGSVLPPRARKRVTQVSCPLSGSWASVIESEHLLQSHTSVPYCCSFLLGDPAGGKKLVLSINTQETLGLLLRNIGSRDKRVCKEGRQGGLLALVGLRLREGACLALREGAGSGVVPLRCVRGFIVFWGFWARGRLVNSRPFSSMLSGDRESLPPAFSIECGRCLGAPQKA